MLQKRNQCGGDAHDLLRRQVHIFDFVRRDHYEIPAVPGRDLIGTQSVVFVDFRIRLGDMVTFAVNG